MNEISSEKIIELNKIINDDYTVVGFLESEYKNIHSKCSIICKIHGNGLGWDTPWTPTFDNLRYGSGCPKCSNRYVKSERELRAELKKYLSNNLSVLSIKKEQKKYAVILNCSIHGDSSKWGNPWIPYFDTLKKGHGCPKCYGNYKQTDQEALSDLNQTIKGKYLFLRFIGGKFKNLQSKCIMECIIHGDSSKWGIPWTPSLSQLKHGQQCPKCNKLYGTRKSNTKILKETVACLNKQLNNKKIKALSFVGKNNNMQTKCIVECKVHGNSSEWGNPWLPTINSLKKSKGCPKCLGLYRYTENEALERLKDNVSKKYEVIGFVEGYKTVHSKCIMKCEVHGIGDFFEKKWNPTIHKLNNGGGCPKCSIEGQDLKKCLTKTKQFQKDRILYYITFQFKGKIFYKIGITNRGVNSKYSSIKLKNNGIKIINQTTLKLKNIQSLLSEYWILKTFSKQRKPMFHIMKDINGGSECFDEDITKIISLKKMVEDACLNYREILNDFNLSIEDYNNSEKEIKKILNEEGFKF